MHQCTVCNTQCQVCREGCADGSIGEGVIHIENRLLAQPLHALHPPFIRFLPPAYTTHPCKPCLFRQIHTNWLPTLRTLPTYLPLPHSSPHTPFSFWMVSALYLIVDNHGKPTLLGYSGELPHVFLNQQTLLW